MLQVIESAVVLTDPRTIRVSRMGRGVMRFPGAMKPLFWSAISRAMRSSRRPSFCWILHRSSPSPRSVISIVERPRPSPAAGPDPANWRTITVGMGEACETASLSAGLLTRATGRGARMRFREVRTPTRPFARARTGADMAWVTLPPVRTTDVRAE